MNSENECTIIMLNTDSNILLQMSQSKHYSCNSIEPFLCFQIMQNLIELNVERQITKFICNK